VPGSHLTRAWRSPALSMWSYKNLRIFSGRSTYIIKRGSEYIPDSSHLSPTMRLVNCLFTYSASAPVTGCFRTTGCTFSTGSLLTIPPRLPFFENSACSTPECTALSVFRNATNCGDSFFKVETCDVNKVSPPVQGWASRKKVVRPGGWSS